ncbi:hypothetical protein JTB14_007826 [Gonioctena quinquepunctata]|nr:hypothetical protein JTB14_007826 [Gonioctena quinquepunctata]
MFQVKPRTGTNDCSSETHFDGLQRECGFEYHHKETTLERKKYSRLVSDVDTNHALPPETITYDERDPYKGDFANSEELRVWFGKIAHVEVISKIARRQG